MRSDSGDDIGSHALHQPETVRSNSRSADELPWQWQYWSLCDVSPSAMRILFFGTNHACETAIGQTLKKRAAGGGGGRGRPHVGGHAGGVKRPQEAQTLRRRLLGAVRHVQPRLRAPPPRRR